MSVKSWQKEVQAFAHALCNTPRADEKARATRVAYLRDIYRNTSGDVVETRDEAAFSTAHRLALHAAASADYAGCWDVIVSLWEDTWQLLDPSNNPDDDQAQDWDVGFSVLATVRGNASAYEVVEKIVHAAIERFAGPHGHREVHVGLDCDVDTAFAAA